MRIFRIAVATSVIALTLTVVCSAQLPEVPPVDLANLSPDDFTDQETDMAYYLYHFHTIADAVVDEGENRGFIDISVWRNKKDNKPYNARVMENHLSFAWFYCTDRPWNLYYAHPAVRAHLEAVLEFWVGMQNEDGRFSEYGSERWNLPATAFATKFMGRTLHLLRDGPPIDEDLHQRVIEADRRAIMATLTDDNLFRHGRRYANQFSNVWAGALSYLDLFDDEEVRQHLEARLVTEDDPFMSPAGYFYEANGPDWGYNTGTEQSNIRMAYHYTRDEPLGEVFVDKMDLWIEWLAYNVVPEPDSRRWVLNRAIESRQKKHSVFTVGNLAVADRVPQARVWTTTQEQLQERYDARRKALEESWPEVSELKVGNFGAYSPYQFLHRDHWQYLPTEAERTEALALVPLIARERFNHQRVDSRVPVQYTFVRRPGYYAALTTGEQVRDQQRYGLGLVWTPQHGAVLQSQTGSDDESWGTRPAGAERPMEAGSLGATFTTGEAEIESEVGARDLPDGPLQVQWSLGESGEKTVVFADDAIEVSVEYPGEFTEQIPLLWEEKPQIADGAIIAGDHRLVEFDGGTVACTRGDVHVGPKWVWVATITATDELSYRIIGTQ